MKKLFNLLPFLILFNNLNAQRVFPICVDGQDYFIHETGNLELESFDLGDRVRDAIVYDDLLLFAGSNLNGPNSEMNKIVAWNGTDYLNFFSQPEDISAILDMVVFENELYITGMGQAQKFNGSDWIQLELGFDTPVRNVEVINDELYLMGPEGVFKLTGDQFFQIGEVFNGTVWSLIEFDGELYAGGEFDTIGNIEARGLALLQDNNWVQLEEGVNGTVYGMTVYNDQLFAVGDFSSLGTNTFNSIARYTGAELTDLPGYAGDEDRIGSVMHWNGSLLFSPKHNLSNTGEGNCYRLTGDNLGVFMREMGQNSSFSSHVFPFGIIEYQNQQYLFGDIDLSRAGFDFRGAGLIIDGTPFMDFVENDNVHVGMNAGTGLFHNPHNNQDVYFETPVDSDLSPNYFSGLFMGAKYDEEVYYAHSRYTPVLSFGPTAEVYDRNYLEKYCRVWRVSQSEIEHHQNHFSDIGYVLPEAIENWPGNGDSSNGEQTQLAPYFDSNSNNLYEPLLGEYPIIRGDHALYTILSDVRHERAVDEHFLGLDVHVMLYIFDDEAESIQNTVFVHYDVRNRSARNYDDFFVGMFSDLDIGNPADDFVGCNPEFNYFYGYNGDSNDESGAGSEGYGVHPPAHGVVLLNASMSSAISYNNSSNPGTGDPYSAEEFYNYVQGRWKDGSPIIAEGNGYPGEDFDTTLITTYMYPDYPWEEGWNEPAAGNSPSDRRMLGSTEIGHFEHNQSFCFDVAFVTAFDLENSGAEAPLIELQEDVIAVQEFYNNQENSCDLLVVPVEEVQNELNISIYPNPASNLLQVEDGHAFNRIYITDAQGRRVMSTTGKGQLDISLLSTGFYNLVLEKDGTVISEPLIINR